MTTTRQGPLTIATAAASDPITTAQAKAHMRVDTTDDDTYIGLLIEAATDYAQRYQRRQYINATWALRLSDFPSEIDVPLSPLVSITSLAYTDTDGNSQTLVEDTDFVVDIYSEPARIMPHRDTSGWPDVQSDIYNAVTLTFVAGMGANATAIEATAEVKRFRRLQHAIYLMVAHLYEEREPIIVGKTITNVPRSIDALLQIDRLARH